MPVVSRNFSSHMVASLCRSVECGSLSLIVGSSVGWLCPHCRPRQSMVCLEHYTVSNVGHIVHSSQRGSTSPSVSPMIHASQAGGNDW